jgi:uncharacterized membrane protein
MRLFGIILIVVGILMFVFRSVSFTKKEKVVDLGSVEISKNEKKSVQWPTYAAGGVALIGLVLVLASKKKT